VTRRSADQLTENGRSAGGARLSMCAAFTTMLDETMSDEQRN
jgi:hypothetical protein